jgi:hypothetical protein
MEAEPARRLSAASARASRPNRSRSSLESSVALNSLRATSRLVFGSWAR